MNAVRKLVVALSALGEMAVGAIIAAFPSVGAWLIGAPIEGTGIVVTRMLGSAVLVVGLTWWLTRGEANPARIVPGVLLYNFGVGVLFALAAASASQPFVPWILAVVHLATGAACAATVPALRERSA